MSKIRMPSHEPFIMADWETLLQLSSLREESTERYSRLPETVTSFCAPGQWTWLTVFGRFGFEMS